MLLRDRASDLEQIADKIESEFSALDDITGGELSFGLAESYQIRYLAKELAELKKKYPNFTYHITSGDTEQVSERLELADIKLGISVCRNPHLANIFYRLQLIEAYGTGIKKIMDSYFGKSKQPSIICSNNAFKIVIPNTNAGQIVKEDSVIYSVAPYSVASSSTLPSAEEQILQVLSRQKEITRKEVQELLEVSQSTAGRILKTMVDRGQIIKLGGSLTTRYRAVL